MFVSAGVVAVGAIAGKRSSLPTLVLSRAAFGVLGNLAPATLLVLSRLFWALVLVILGYLLIAQSLTSTSGVLAAAVPVSPVAIGILIAVVGASVALASFGGRRLVWAQRISGLLGVVTAVTIAGTRIASHGAAGTLNQEGSWLRALGAAVVIFAVFGLAWSSASADYASGLPVNVRGWKVASWALLAMGAIPVALTWFALVAFGDLTSDDFAGSFNVVVSGTDFGLVGMLTQISLFCTLLTALAMSLRSSSMSFESIQLKLKPAIASPVIAAVAVALAILGLARLGSAGFWFNLHGYSLVLAVPVAAWSGIFVSDVLIRRIAYHEVSLSRSYGFYKAINLTNVLGWIIAVILGWGLLKSDLVEFQWLGYLSNYASNSLFWSVSNFGIVIAFALGLLLPVAGGMPRIKKQEVEVLQIEARRNDLKDVLGVVD
jgi:purine-cytosine permease-like protein